MDTLLITAVMVLVIVAWRGLVKVVMSSGPHAFLWKE